MTRFGRLEAASALTGAVANDVNNMIAAVLGNLALVRAALPESDPLQDRLGAAEEAAERARDLARQLLTFARGGEPVRKPIAVPELLRDAVRLALRGTDARCDFEIQPDLWGIDADAGQISQAVQNIALNAADAMPGGGTLLVRAENVLAQDALDMVLPTGRYVRISIADGGHGIPLEDRARIFDPFFTTRPHRAGLGLAAAYAIVQKHAGAIAVHSEPGRGTTIAFCVRAVDLPRAASVARDGESSLSKRRILIMDDEPLIREVIGIYLEKQGFAPVLAREGHEAIDLYRAAIERGERFDAVIMDLTVPGGMGGAEAIARLHELDPDVRAIVASGYSNDPVMAHHEEYGFQAALAKPFRANDLAEALGAVLSA